jgi:hypothetical protein
MRVWAHRMSGSELQLYGITRGPAVMERRGRTSQSPHFDAQRGRYSLGHAAQDGRVRVLVVVRNRARAFRVR